MQAFWGVGLLGGFTTMNYDSYKRLAILLDEFPSESNKVSLPRPKGLLTLENLVVTPPGSKEPVIKGVSLKINPGDIVGIVGPSGSGKSTLVRAMVGVWKPSSGIVRLDGADIFSWPKSELGQYLGYLPQDVELFSGTVAENIARFSEINSELVLEAAMKSGIHEMVLRLPEGYETQIGDLGASLSGGQRQRIALARAFYNNPVLYILDEPNSNLDESGEASLLAAITNLKQQGHTVILVTHRPNILHIVDKLMVVAAGRLQAFGPKELVMQEISNQKKNITKQDTISR
jgi:ABC-type protease/lipase transport system fused ATPase/permease subunit